MNKHLAKTIAPVIVSVCLIAYYLFAGLILLKFNLPVGIKAAAVIVTIIISAAVVFVLIERIKEIRKGEEDDIGKY